MPYGTFEEKQRFNQVWLWIILLGVSTILLYQIPVNFIREVDGNELGPTRVLILIGSILFVIGLLALFFYARLSTRINNESIEITFSPFFTKPKVINWAEIDEAFLRKYNSLFEYGGWGIRFSWKGRAYNTSGNIGLQLILKSGKKILIGTHKAEELDNFLKKYIQTKTPNYSAYSE